MIDEAIKGAEELSDACRLEISKYSFFQKKVAPCLSCLGCEKKADCVLEDDFGEFKRLWLASDAVIYGIPVYHRGIPAQVKAAIDRLGQSLFAARGRARGMPRFHKAIGMVVQGGSKFGGQEIASAQIVEHALLMKCIPVAGDSPGAKIAVFGHAPSSERGSIVADEQAVKASRVLGRRVVETAAMLKVGGKAMEGCLMPGYYERFFA